MDCPSEENLIRLKLEELTNIKYLEFDIPKRILFVFHSNEDDHIILEKLSELKLGESLMSFTEIG